MGPALLYAMVYVLIFGLIVGIILFLIGKIPDATIQNYARLAVYILVGLALIFFLISLLPAAGGGGRLSFFHCG